MSAPRQIYVATLSRRERSWGRRRSYLRIARPAIVAGLGVAAAVLSGLRF